jgi:hypothetical protein
MHSNTELLLHAVRRANRTLMWPRLCKSCMLRAAVEVWSLDTAGDQPDHVLGL